MKRCFQSESEQETIAIGSKLGALLKGGEVVELVSDVGGGKTTITKGIVAGCDSSDLVSSPTFTVSNVYSGAKLDIHHYDFYRIGELGLMSEELQEVLESRSAISVIEWAGEASNMLPSDRVIRITLSRDMNGEDVRNIGIEYPDSMASLGAIGGKEC